MNISEVRVDVQALIGNLASLRASLAPETKVAAVVKGNAYGHGLELVVRALEGQVDYFQVDDLDELERLRSVSSTPALVLGFVAPWEMKRALELGCELGVYNDRYLATIVAAAESLNKRVRVHVEVDAQLGRLGVLPDQLESLLDKVGTSSDSIELAGIYAHFANIEDTTDLAHAEVQNEILIRCADRVKDLGYNALTHISATSGVIAMESRGAKSLVRLGIGLYGMYPSLQLERSHRHLGLTPALTWKSVLGHVKELPARHPVGYGLTFITPRPMKIGIVPLGYSDGYDRGLSNCGEVLVRGKRCAVLGRIAMNMFAIDLTEAEGAAELDEVVLIGAQRNERITAEELASRIGTINYEVTTRISPHLPRIEFSEGSG